MSRTAAERAAISRDAPDDTAWCRRCHVYIRRVDDLDDQSRIASSVHHRRKRDLAGADAVANLVLLCGTGTTGCHGMCHSSRHSYQMWQDGWVCRDYENPAERYCVTTYGTLLMFLDDGSVVEDRQLTLPSDDPWDPAYGIEAPL